MNYLSTSLILALVILQVYCQVLVETDDPTIKHKGHCFARRWGVGEMKKGEVRNVFENDCKEVACAVDHTHVTYTECMPVSVPGGCSVQEDKSKPFPDCCRKTVC